MKPHGIAAVCVLLTISFSSADTVWNPAANSPPVVPPAVGNWNDAGNWTLGAPVPVTPGEIKGVLNVVGAADCVVTDAQSLNQLVMNVNGTGSVLRVQNGGDLSTGVNWSAVGYTQPGSWMIVEDGGTASFGDHLWVGFNSSAVGTLDIDGGTVNVAGQFGLGWEGGSGQAKVRNGGVLNLDRIAGVQSISSSSVLDIESGLVVIDGDYSSIVHDFINEGRITGYGTSGTPIYDYNVSSPGKTTIRAITGQIGSNWHVASTTFPTDDLIVTPFDAAADFGIVADGVTDVTEELQTALTLLGNLGGGALFLPAGHYEISGNLTIPPGVTLRGDWRKPLAGQAVAGTVLKAYAGRDDENAAPFITLSNSAGVNGVSIWYPEQLPNDIRPYPPTIGNGGGATVENVTFVNSYFGYTSYVAGTTARPFLRNICGTPLMTGIEFDSLADIGRIESVHFSPDYWKDSGLANAPTADEHAAWIYDNGAGMIVRRIDWSYSCYVTVEGYSIGLALRPGRHDAKTPNGQSYGFNLLGCKTGIHIEDNSYAGYQFTRFDIQQAETGVYLGPATSKATMFHTCSIEASGAAVFGEGTGRVLMMSCDIQQGPVQMDSGYLSIINADFAADSPSHIELGGEVRGATILGNRFGGAARIIDRTGYPVHIDHTALPVDPLPAYDYKKPTSTYQPATSDLFVVTTAPYNAQADGVTDDTAAFQAALAAADANGGGTVYVPGGTYRLDGTLTVPTGVELRGIFDTPNDTKTKGSLLNVYSGRNNANGTPFIQLETGAGVRGLTFHYPAQAYDGGDPVNYGMVPYPFLIRGLGADVYAINLAATIPYQLLDLATHRCDRHYIDYIFATALKTGIHVGNGAVDGQIHNCQFNPSAYTHAGSYYASIPYNTSDDIHEILWRDATPYLFGHMSGEVLHENFVFGGALGFHLVNEGGSGPSGHCLGMGVDQCTNAMQIDDVGSGGLDLINSQIVTVNATDGHYLETGASLQDTFRMFSSAGWGTHEFSAVLNGGDIELQLFHLARDGESGAFKVRNDATLQNFGGNLGDYLGAGRPFLTIDPSASAEFTGNIINTTSGQMPNNTSNVTSNANLRVGEAATGADLTWTNGNGNRSWTTSANWNGGVPDGTDATSIGNDAILGPVISAGTNASTGTLVVGDLTSTADRLDLTGGSLATTGWLILGSGTGNHGTLAISDGAATIGSDLFVGLHGAGTLEMSGGSLTVGGAFAVASNAGATGTVSLDAGTIEAASLHMTSGGLLDLTDGTLVIDGDASAIIGTYISNGWITAYGGANAPGLDYDTSNPGKTTVTGTPPALGSTIWAPGGSNLWTGDSNWSGGAAPLDQSQHLKVVFNVDGAGACLLDTTATVGLLSMGDHGTSNGNSLTLAAGANLTAGIDAYGRTQWTGVGYNRDSTMTVESGATLNCQNHLWVGLIAPALGTLDINGGTVNVSGMLGLGWDTGTGKVDVRNGGILNLTGFHPTQSINGASVLDIETGSVVIPGNQTEEVEAYVTAEKITAYGGAGTVNVSHDPGPDLTTISSTAPSSGFDLWAQGWGEDIGAIDNDHDGDTRDNLYEYALNGDPTDALDQGVAPRLPLGVSGLEFRHLVRRDDADLIYTVQSSPDLTPGSWVEAGFSVQETIAFDANYDEIAYSVPTTATALFVRLMISYP